LWRHDQALLLAVRNLEIAQQEFFFQNLSMQILSAPKNVILTLSFQAVLQGGLYPDPALFNSSLRESHN